MKRLLLIPALWMALAPLAGAQCVMCYRTAKSQNEARSHVLNAGIVVLGAPPFPDSGGLHRVRFQPGQGSGRRRVSYSTPSSRSTRRRSRPVPRETLRARSGHSSSAAE